MLSYEFSLREHCLIDDDWPFHGWDLFLSAYNLSERVGKVFEKATASQKCWFISPEYAFSSLELPLGYPLHQGSEQDEAGSIVSWLLQVCPDAKNKRICIDSTGFMRHHLMILMKHLVSLGVRQFDVLYSEPDQYKEKEKTTFSVGDVSEVRQVSGFEGTHNPDTSNDLLIIGAGYDHPLIAHAAEFKSNARKLQVLGFPSLRPDMYQENVLQVQKAAEQVGGRGDGMDTVFVPANDPFNTALKLHNVVEQFSKTKPITNLYLCPISTKAMTVGFGLYYLAECDAKSVSMILPYTKKYSKGTSEGVGRVWWYRVEL